jgi:hypothetical protein
MPPSRDSPPRSVRRKSGESRPTGSSDGEQRDSVPPTKKNVTGDNISIHSTKLRNILLKSLEEKLESFKKEVAIANDPDFPRQEVLNQMKICAKEMYSACKVSCEFAFDVPRNSVLIHLSFVIGVQGMITETLKALKIQVPPSRIEAIAAIILNDCRSRHTSETNFAPEYIEKFIETQAVAFGIISESQLGAAQAPVISRSDSSTGQPMTPTRSLKVGRTLTPGRLLYSPPPAAFYEFPKIATASLDEKMVYLTTVLKEVELDKKAVDVSLSLIKDVCKHLEKDIIKRKAILAAQRFSQETQ